MITKSTQKRFCLDAQFSPGPDSELWFSLNTILKLNSTTVVTPILAGLTHIDFFWEVISSLLAEGYCYI